jgi:hypothetical protein
MGSDTTGMSARETPTNSGGNPLNYKKITTLSPETALGNMQNFCT